MASEKLIFITLISTILSFSCLKQQDANSHKNLSKFKNSNLQKSSFLKDSLLMDTRKIDLIKLLDSTYKIERVFNDPIKFNLIESLNNVSFNNYFERNYVFYLNTQLSGQPLWFYPAIRTKNLLIYKLENTGFLIFDAQSRESLFIRFDIKQSNKKKIELKHFLACHFLDANLLSKFSIVKLNDPLSKTLILQKYFQTPKNYIIEQGILKNDSLKIELFYNYQNLREIGNKVIEKNNFLVNKTFTSYYNYENNPTFFLPTFNIPYENPFD